MKIRARCKCGARIVVQDAARAQGAATTGSIERKPVRWFVDITSWEPIAMDMSQLERAFQAGRIDGDTMVWRKGMSDWARLRNVRELAITFLGEEEASRAPDNNGDWRPGSEPPRRPDPSVPPERTAHGARIQTPPARYAISGSQAPSSPPTQTGLGALRPEQLRGKTTLIGTPAVRAAAGVESQPPEEDAPAKHTLDTTRHARDSEEYALDSEEHALDSEEHARDSEEYARDSAEPSEGPSSAPLSGEISDETPAQKPSTLSVAPASSGRRGARRTFVAVAAAAAVFGSVAVVRWNQQSNADSAAITIERNEPLRWPRSPHPKAEDVVSPPAPATPEEESAVQKPVIAEKEASSPAPEREAPTTPSGTEEPSAEPPSSSSRVPPPQPSVVQAPKPSPPAPKPAQSKPSRPQPAQAPQKAPKAAAPSTTPAPQQARDASEAPPPPLAPAPSPAAESNTPPAPNESAEAASESSPAKPPPATRATHEPAAKSSEEQEQHGKKEKPAAAPVEAATQVPAARPFPNADARNALAVAARRAAACGQPGGSSGTGEIRLLVSPNGRVARITAMTSTFLNTPVGACLEQVYRQITVPPFDGAPVALSGTFAVKPR